MVRTILLFLLLGAVDALGQSAVYVAYDGARLYSDADYLSEIIDTLAIGDTLVKLESAKKFVRVRARDIEGWILAANVSERPPKATAGRKAATTSRAPNGQSGLGATENGSASSTTDDGSARCAATTKSGTQCSRKAGAGSAYCWQHAK